MTRHSRRRPSGILSLGFGRPLGLALPIVATLSIIAPLAWLWQDSRVPSAYSVMNMGYPDYGAGAMTDPDGSGHGGHMQGQMGGQQMPPPIWLPTRPGRPTYASIWSPDRKSCALAASPFRASP